MSSPTVGDVIACLDAMYPPATAEEWDVVGLTCGEMAAPVRRVMFAIDPLPLVIDEALGWGADLLVTHHPLLLSATHSVATDTWKGSALHRLIRGGCALFTAHTNADGAQGGVNDALADALGLTDVSPLCPWSQDAEGEGGLGRVGLLASPLSLAEFAEQVAGALPATPGGVRYLGDPDATVARVAVCGGSGDSLLDDAACAGVDAYVTADLRHHRASEHLAAGGPALVDPGHWASEWPWLPRAAQGLKMALAVAHPAATTVETHVSNLVTDPVTGMVRSQPEEDR